MLARLPKETSKQKIQVCQRAELFEARRPKDSAIIAENDSNRIWKRSSSKQKISIVSSNGETSNYLIPKGKHVNFNQVKNKKRRIF